VQYGVESDPAVSCPVDGFFCASTFLASAWPSPVGRDSGRRCRPPICSCAPPPFIVLTLFIVLHRTWHLVSQFDPFINQNLSFLHHVKKLLSGVDRLSQDLHLLFAGPSPEFTSRGGPKIRRGNIFKIQYWVYAATGGPNVKWGAPIPNGGPGTTGPPAGNGPGCSSPAWPGSKVERLLSYYGRCPLTSFPAMIPALLKPIPKRANPVNISRMRRTSSFRNPGFLRNVNTKSRLFPDLNFSEWHTQVKYRHYNS